MARTHAAPPTSRTRRLVCAVLSTGALVALAGPAPAHALAGSSVNGTTPTVSVAATGGAAAAPATIPTATTTTTLSATGARQSTGSRVVVVHARAHSASKLSNTAIAAAALAALIALGCLVWGVARMLAYEPRWTLSLRHVMAEAGYRASATWAEFGDWARLGR